jgi:predicted RNA binding protein YcfA (HicA-like mRNA interferase family)
MEAEEALATSGFVQGRSKGHTRAWHYEEITLTLHRPHGKHLNPGAVALIIKTIEEAGLRQERKEKETPTHVR